VNFVALVEAVNLVEELRYALGLVNHDPIARG
jgi:hypothetical protein